jgi:hypothetical protein
MSPLPDGPQPFKGAQTTEFDLGLTLAMEPRAGVRPFTTTDAPSAASAVAIASPIPAMEPILTAVLAWTPKIHLPACLPRPFAVATPRSLAGSNRRDSFALHRKDLTPEEDGNRP